MTSWADRLPAPGPGPLQQAPFLRQRMRHLHDFNRVEWFFQDEKPLERPDGLAHIGPGIIGVGGAERRIDQAEVQRVRPRLFYFPSWERSAVGWFLSN